MFGIIIITHGKLGTALLETAEEILSDRLHNVAVVSIDTNDTSEKIRHKIQNSIKRVRQGSGVLILTDMFGGTPSNLSYAFLHEGQVEVLSGVNLPTLLKAVTAQKSTPLDEAAPIIETHAKKSISLASGRLKTDRKG